MMKSQFIINNFIGVPGLFIVILLISILSSCKTDNTVVPDNNSIEVTKTGCKTELLLADSSKEDCIEYEIINNTLHIRHINAAFNCCPNKVYAIASISNDTIRITEKEILTDPCKCNCLYDIEYNIQNITDSLYVIEIKEPYILNDTDKIIFNINTIKAAVGSYCTLRTEYPWN